MDTILSFPSSKSEVIFSYGAFPIAVNNKLPIVCEQNYSPTSIIPDKIWINYLRKSRSLMVQGAAALTTPSPASYNYFLKVFPEYAHKMHLIPYYLPYLKGICEDKCIEKYENLKKINLLFVGKEGKRKGLDIFIKAYERLQTKEKNAFEVRVISQLLDGNIEIPKEFQFDTFVSDIISVFERTHILIFPTKQEAYGLVLVEAMAAGCNIITTNHPIQKSILNEEGGWFINPHSVNEMETVLKQLLTISKEELLTNAIRNLNNFLNDKCPDVVGQKYFELFKKVSTNHRQAEPKC